MLGFAVSIIALKMQQRTADSKLTFGWHRAEIVGTLISVLTIWTITVVLLIEATKMLIRGDQRVHGGWMLGVALVGLLFNLIQMRILH